MRVRSLDVLMTVMSNQAHNRPDGLVWILFVQKLRQLGFSHFLFEISNAEIAVESLDTFVLEIAIFHARFKKAQQLIARALVETAQPVVDSFVRR